MFVKTMADNQAAGMDTYYLWTCGGLKASIIENSTWKVPTRYICTAAVLWGQDS